MTFGSKAPGGGVESCAAADKEARLKAMSMLKACEFSQRVIRVLPYAETSLLNSVPGNSATQLLVEPGTTLQALFTIAKSACRAAPVPHPAYSIAEADMHSPASSTTRSTTESQLQRDG